MFTANFVHVYREFCSCLPQILFMFTANFVHVYRKFKTFRQADSGPTRGGKAPAGPIKNNFSGGGLLRSVGGDLGGDGKWVDASRRNWKAPDNKLPQILFMFTAKFVHVYRKFFFAQILFMFTANFVHVYRKKNVLFGTPQYP